MKSEDIERGYLIRRCTLENASPYIGDRYKDLKTVKVFIRITFNSAVLRSPSITECCCTLAPSNKLFLHYACTNPTCTGYGFDLTDVLIEVLNSRNSLEGSISCKGKEDWKYYDSSGCRCDTVLEYRIEPEFE